MERRVFLAGGLSALSLTARGQGTGTQPAPREAGRVELADGDVRFLDSSRQTRRPRAGDSIFEGESIVTGKDGEVHLNMDDGGYIAVRPDTRMRIAVFKAEGASDDRSVIGLLAGSFRSITGWIGKLGGNQYRINTPTATIGVRGTDHEPLVIAPGSTDGEPGTYDRVHTGETSLRTPQGEVRVKPAQAGFTPHGGGMPRKLDRVPARYRPGRHDQRFEGLHDRIHAQLGDRREQRRRLVQERRQGRADAAPGAAGGRAPLARPSGDRPAAARPHLERPHVERENAPRPAHRQ